MKNLRIAAFCAIVSVGVVCVLASRNSSGVYTLPTGNPVTTGTPISSTWANNTFGDVAAALTDSLSVSGKGAMQAPLLTPDGSATFPTLTFTNETGTGLYRIGTNDVGFTVGGAKKLELTGTTFTVTPNMLASGTLGVSGVLSLSSPIYGTVTTGTGLSLDSNLAAGDAGYDMVANTLNTRTNGFLFAVSNANTPKLTLDYAGNQSLTGNLTVNGKTVVSPGYVPSVNGNLWAVQQGAPTTGLLQMGSVGHYLTYTGSSFAFDQPLNMNGQPINLVAAPTAEGDAANKAYVEGMTAVAWGGFSIGAAGAVTVSHSFNIASASWSSQTLTINFTSTVSGNYACIVQESAASGTFQANTVQVDGPNSTNTHVTARQWVMSTGAAAPFVSGQQYVTLVCY